MTHKLPCPRLSVKVLSAFFALFAFALLAVPAAQASPTPTILISQIMGAGGNGTAPPPTGNAYTADYVELFNYGSSSVTLTGWTLQYASATSTTAVSSANTFAIPTVTLAPGEYYLISGAVTANGGTADPSDLQTTATLSGYDGRIFLVDSTTSLPAASVAAPSTDSTIVDMVGYGSTAEGAPASYEGTSYAPGPTSSTISYTSYIQRTNICVNNYSNSTEWTLQTIPTPGTTPSTSTNPVGASAPHNTTSTKTVCVHTTPATAGTPTATPSTVKVGNSTLLTVTVTPGTNPTSTGVAVKADLSAFGLGTSVAFNDAGTGGDATAGDNVYSYTLAVPLNQTPNSYNINVTVTDTQGDTIAPVVIPLTVSLKATSSVALTANPAAPAPNQSTVLTATLSPNTATGTVLFYDYGNQIGGTTNNVSNGVATATVTFAAGGHQLTANYSGDSNYATSMGSLSLAVSAPVVPDFTLALSNAQVVEAGTAPSANVGVYVTAVGGFSSTISLACSGLPSNASCSFSPRTFSVNTTTTGPYEASVLTLTVDTSANVKPGLGGKAKSGLAVAFTLLMAPFALRRRRPALRLLALLVVLFAGMQMLTGCSNGGTPAGTSTITVTATATSGQTHTGTITLVTQ